LLYNHYQNALKHRFATISVSRWNSCDLSKCVNGH